ncbi:MAG TPA: C39 family peptidase [Terriglobales bacterium]|jgi:ABC-type bacteriocin/lantibiotic exporter with double-glycine peptidase domain
MMAASVPSGIWLDVPFVKQEKDGCGAASIAMVMQYWQRQLGKAPDSASDAAHIQQVLYAPDAHGIFASEVERYLREQGFRTFSFRGEWSDLKQHLEKGRPLMVALKPSSRAPMHYVVVAGLDGEHNIVLVNDPAQRKLQKRDLTGFEREWNAAGNWTLLALPQVEVR